MANKSLVEKITAGSTSLIFCALAIALIANYWQAVTQSNLALKKQLTRQLTLLSQSLENPVWALDENTVRLIGDTYMAGTDAVSLKVFLTQRKEPLYSKEKNLNLIAIDGQTELSHNNQIIGHINIGLSGASYSTALSRLLTYSIVLAFFIFLILSFVTKSLFKRYLGTPLGNLGDWTDKVAAGDYGGSPPTMELDELNSLANKFSNMSEKIQSREESLQTSERIFRRLFENTEVSIWNEDLSEVYTALENLRQRGITDFRQYLEENPQTARSMAGMVKVIRINEATLRLFDAKTHDEMLGNIDKTFGPNSINVFIDEICAIWDKRETFRSEASFRTLNGKEINTIISFHIPRIKEDFRSLPVSIIDITTEKAAEQSLLRMDQMKNEFISTAAHELRTPLSAIMGFTEFLRTPEDFGGFTKEQEQDFVNEIYGKGEALCRIVDDLLDVSRIESGASTTLNLHEIDFIEVLGKNFKSYQLHNKSHIFHLDLPDNPSKSLLLIDHQRINQVLENLLNNAVKYSPEGTEIVLIGRETPNGWEVKVKDQGVGMSQEQLDHIFDKFYRADASDTATSGLGLGLSIVKEIVEAHGGNIRVESSQGKGSTVIFNLPYATV